MSEATEIFMRFWSKKINLNQKINVKNLINHENFLQYSAIILSANKNNFSKLIKLKSFQQSLKFFDNIDNYDENFMAFTQYEILKNINFDNVKSLQSYLNTLKNEGIGAENNIYLSSYLKNIKPKIIKQNKIKVKQINFDKNYHEISNEINQITQNLSDLFENENYKKRLTNICEKLKNTKFVIGVTGVMNAGKSTLLNALLGKEILGTSVVPETANLSIIKYAKEEKAIINFWNKKQWQEIKNSALHLEAMRTFVKETESIFGNNLDEYIQEETKKQEVLIQNLSLYTSAKTKEKYCNLIKSVELYTNLEYVKNGVCIVDTPGLDDPVIQREEITKSFLNECDLMIHLMNVAQSATKKDIDFIIHSLLYQNISSLLILITRIDTVEENELLEVINYTKQSIKKQLENINKQSKFDEIISKIQFLPIAGKLALMHKIGDGKKADELGYSLEKTGLPKLELYLKDMLFGTKSTKAKLIIKSTKLEIESLISKTIHELKSEKNNLNLSADELDKIFHQKTKQNQENQNFLANIKSILDEEATNLKNYFFTLEKLAIAKLAYAKRVIKQRIVDDVSYELRKNKSLPKESRIEVMIESGFKDFLIDLIREYRYEFFKNMNMSFEKISNLFDKFETKNIINLDLKEYFDLHFKSSFQGKNYIILVKEVNKSIKNAKLKQLDRLNIELEEHFNQAIKSLELYIMPLLKNLNENLLSDFLHHIEKPMNEYEEEIKYEEEKLKNQILNLKNQTLDKNARKEEINFKIELISNIKQSLIS